MGGAESTPTVWHNPVKQRPPLGFIYSMELLAFSTQGLKNQILQLYLVMKMAFILYRSL